MPTEQPERLPRAEPSNLSQVEPTWLVEHEVDHERLQQAAERRLSDHPSGTGAKIRLGR